jgi:hypothetical protein
MLYEIRNHCSGDFRTISHIMAMGVLVTSCRLIIQTHAGVRHIIFDKENTQPGTREERVAESWKYVSTNKSRDALSL